MAKGDWIPRKELELRQFAAKWMARLTCELDISRFGWDAEAIAAVAGAIKAFESALAGYQALDTSANRRKKEETRDSLMAAMRLFANSQIRFNTKMGETDREAFGIKPRDTTPTVQLPPKSQPEVTAWHTKNHFEVLVKAMGHGADEDRRPEDAYGVRYVWQVGGGKPENGEDLGRQKFSRKTSHTVVFKEADRGKTVYISACYENGKGETGPYAAIIEEIIA